jgi:hypothetical protein
MTQIIVIPFQESASLGVPIVGAVKYDCPHLADHPDNNLDHPYCARHHCLAAL